jgi:MFS family permease
LINPFRRWSAERKSLQIASETVHASDAEDSPPSDAVEKYHITEENSFSATGFAFPTLKKWAIITSIFVVQLSMNFNAAVVGNAIHGMSSEFDISVWTARLSQVVFLIMYAFGCEAWAPWSEELGRKWVLQGSLFLVNLCQIPCALARKFGLVVAFRVLGGLCSAGGSVTLGMVADMWTPTDQQFAVNYVVLSSVSGSVFGPFFGGFIQVHLGWRWVFWVSLIFGGFTQLLHLFVPETNTKILLDREAKRQRSSGQNRRAIGPLEAKGASFRERLEWREVVRVMFRPYKLLITEPIVRWLSLFSGFSDSLIFTGLESFPLILGKWNFTIVEMGLAFSSLLVGYLLCWAIFQYIYTKDRAAVRRDPNVHTPERRLKALLYLGPLLPIGLLGLGFCSLGPNIPWIAPLLFIMLIGIAN